MDGIIKIITAFVKLTLAILEGALRAILATFLTVILVASVAASGIIMIIVLIKYGNSTTGNCDHRTVCGLVIATGWALAAYFVLKTIRSFF